MALIALGVTGGIGAYKAVEVARGLQKRGHDVVALMTRNARRFVGEVTFEAITRRRVITGQWTPGANADIEHIAIASDIGLLLVVPATANTIGKFAHGIADDFLSSLYLATTAPVLLAPAMNTNMLAHPAVQQNVQTLAVARRDVCRPGRGVPGVRMDWQGTAGGSRRDRGSGRGRARAPAHAARQERRGDGRSDIRGSRPGALHRQPVERPDGLRDCRPSWPRRGAEVTLITGPTAIELPAVASVIRVRSAAQMHRAVLDARAAGRRAGDGRRRRQLHARCTSRAQKIAHDDEALSVRLAPTPDILADVVAWRAREGRDRAAARGICRRDRGRRRARAGQAPAQGHRRHRRQRRVASRMPALTSTPTP